MLIVIKRIPVEKYIATVRPLTKYIDMLREDYYSSVVFIDPAGYLRQRQGGEEAGGIVVLLYRKIIIACP